MREHAYDKGYRNALFKQIIVSSLMLLMFMISFFTSAGHLNLPQAWVFFGSTFVYFTVSALVLYWLNPELLLWRLKRRRESSKYWDEILMRASNLTAIIVVPAIAGLDVGRFHWSGLTIEFAAVGYTLYFVSSVLINWAMVVNPHFEPTVRIQEDRAHRVIMAGPYRFVRHPGYLSGILWTLSIPLILGSVFAFFPVGVYILLMVIRTSLEDSTLCRELKGFVEYSERVRYRLFPGFW